MPERIRKLFRPGGVIYLTVGVLSLVTIVWAGLWSFSAGGLARRPDPLTTAETGVVLTRVGLDAASLTAAGLTTQQVQTVVSNARTHLSENIQGVRDADQGWADARKEADRLAALIQGGVATQQDLSAYATAQSTLTTAASTRQTELNAVFTAAVNGLASGPVTILNAVKASRAAGWDVPTQYLTVARDEADWVTLRGALANQRVNAKQSAAPSAAAAQVLLAEDANATVAAAKSSLDTNLTAHTSTWSAAVNTLP